MIKSWYILSTVSAVILFNGCNSTPQPTQREPIFQIPEPQFPTIPQELNNTLYHPIYIPPRPKKVHKLKKVEDHNFDPEYMYPGTELPSKESTISQQTREKLTFSTSMNREQCIKMLGADKFSYYTEMLGDEAGAIKRCVMLQSMQ